MATYNFLDKTGLGQVWAKIKALIVQSDWTEDDSTDPSYIQNRPAIRAGEVENSIIEGQVEQDEDAVLYELTITGDANATTYTYTTQETLPTSIAYLVIQCGTNYRKVVSINTSNNTIGVDKTLSTAALINSEALLYSKYKKAIGEQAHAEGKWTFAVGTQSHAEGSHTYAIGVRSHTEGTNNTASGVSSHVEGQQNIASGSVSHAEGLSVKATNTYAHAEGSYTTASGNSAHAEGRSTIAAGNHAHAEGIGAKASSECQHAQGKYNIEDSNGTYADIVGNGTADNARSNAYTLDWNGNGVYAGKVTVGAGPTNNMDVATKQYVDNAIPAVQTPDWDENDSTSPAYVQNRTHYRTSAGYIAPIDLMPLIEWLEEYSDTITIDGNNYTYNYWADYRIFLNDQYANYFPTDSLADIDTEEATTTLVVNGVSQTVNFWHESENNQDVYYNSDYFIYIWEDGGLCVSCASANNNALTSLQINIPITNEAFTYSKLDSAYLDGRLIESGSGHMSEIFNGTYGKAASGNYSHAEGEHSNAIGASSHAEGSETTASGDYSHSEGNGTIAEGWMSHAEGGATTASGSHSHSEGDSTIASGDFSHSEGSYTTASGDISHAEGSNTTASGDYSHAEGSSADGFRLYLTGSANATTYTVTSFSGANGAHPKMLIGATIDGKEITNVTYLDNAPQTITLNATLSTTAITKKSYFTSYIPSKAAGVASHAEGCGNRANGEASHAEGTVTFAGAQASHTEGLGTIASSVYQHVQGTYNIEDANTAYADIVGNGTSSARSNAYTLDWNGNGWFAGKVSAGTVANPASVVNANDLATKAYVDAQAGESDVFWVNFEDDYEHPESESLVADKTFTELTAAWSSGKIIQATYYGQIYQLANTFDGGQENRATFVQSTPINSDNGTITLRPGYIYWRHEENNDSISYTQSECYAPDIASPSSSGFSNGQILQYNSTSGKWEAANLPTVPDDLGDLTDTAISSPSNGQVLKYNSTTSKWENSNIPAGVTVTLNGSTTTTPSFFAPTGAGTLGQVLKSNGSGAPIWAAESSDVMVVTITDGQTEGTYECDTLMSTIYGAILNGQIVIAQYGLYILYVGEWQSEVIKFYQISPLNSSFLYGYQFNIWDDNTVEGIYTEFSIPNASTVAPVANGTASIGVSTAYARADHVHPKITQTISMASNVITLSGSDGTSSTVTLPIYNGGVQTV